MLVEFIKDHPVGIPKGEVINTDITSAQRWVNQGLATCEELKPNEDAKEDRKAFKNAFKVNTTITKSEEKSD